MTIDPSRLHASLTALVSRIVGGSLGTRVDRAFLVEEVARVLQADRVGIWYRSMDGTRLVSHQRYLRLDDGYDQGEELRQDEIPPYFAALASPVVMAVPDVASDSRTAALPPRYHEPRPVHALLDATVVVEGEVRGVLGADVFDGPREWTAAEQSYLLSVAGLVAYLTLSEERADERSLLRMTSRLAQLGAWRLDLESGELWWSDEVRALHEVPPEWSPRTAEALEFYLPEDRPRVLEAVRGALETGSPYDIEAKITTAAGRILHVRTIGEPYRGADGAILGIHGGFQDITTLRRAQEEVARSEERLRFLAAATSDAIWDWDLLTDEVWWSPGVEALLGYRREEVGTRMRSWMELVHPEDLPAAERSFEAALESGALRWRTEYRMRRKDGGWARIVDRATMIRDHAGVVVRAIGGLADITERRLLEQRVLEGQKLESVGRLAAGIAHDFNNLLTAVLGVAEIRLDESTLSPDLAEDLEEIRDAALRGSHLTRQLLAFSRQQVLQLEELDLNEVVQGALRLLRRLGGANVEVRLVETPELPPVRADRIQIEQVLLNLVVNARDAMPDGGVVEVHTGRDELHDGAEGEPESAGTPAVKVAVMDHGTGMPPEVMARAFEPFFTTKPQGRGTGLGLATAYGIVEQLGGEIRLESEAGKGSTFTVVLPAALPPSGGAPAPQDTPEAPAETPESPAGTGHP